MILCCLSGHGKQGESHSLCTTPSKDACTFHTLLGAGQAQQARAEKKSHCPSSASLNLEKKKKSPNKKQAQQGKEWYCPLLQKGYLILPNWEHCPRAESFNSERMHPLQMYS